MAARMGSLIDADGGMYCLRFWDLFSTYTNKYTIIPVATPQMIGFNILYIKYKNLQIVIRNNWMWRLGLLLVIFEIISSSSF